VEELLAGTEPVHEEVPGAVQSVQETLLTLAVMPVLSHERAGDRVILLFHMRVVILVIGTGMGERDTSGMTESVETIHVSLPLPGVGGWRQDPSGGEATVSRAPYGDAHVW